ncbi:MAG: N-formylglutamate amidohydrolase [Deltaproteobacteria bacterium]|nr:N-formylglutamate amidohydrolase [Deltaproteobacteria bacterium]
MPRAEFPVSIDDVCEVTRLHGVDAVADAAPDLLIEVPHGATRALHFQALRAQLKGPFPDDLIDFFFVNTDVGAPETALLLAAQVTRAEPRRSVAVIRALIPRTFIDCNRVVDGNAMTSASVPGGVTPGVVRYVTDAADLRLLFERYSAYRAAVSVAFEQVCDAGGTAVMLHSYAPRSVDVPVDEHIVAALHAAYQPEVETTWPLRSAIDFITRTPEGTLLTDAALVTTLRDGFAAAGIASTEGSEYPLHPSTVAHVFASRWPRQTLLIELRRDLLVKAFTPFLEMEADTGKCDRLAGLLAEGLRNWWTAKAS